VETSQTEHWHNGRMERTEAKKFVITF